MPEQIQYEAQRSRLDPGKLMTQAQAITGLSDFGSMNFVEPFSRHLDRAAREVDFTAEGLETYRNDLLRHLVNRLRTQADIRRHPEILQEDVSDPIVIIGLPRTGTTKMQRMMASAPDVQKLKLWRMLNPAPFPGAIPGQPDPRATMGLAGISDNDASLAGHAMLADLVDEDFLLFDFTLDPTIGGISPYLPLRFCEDDWIPGQEREADRDGYRYERTLLQYLQWQDGGKRNRPWILKSISHFAHLDALLECFPNATLVHCHRDPRVTIPSVGKLQWAVWGAKANVDKTFPAQVFLHWGSVAMKRYLETRRRLQLDERIIDVKYADIRDNAMAVIREVYKHAGLELTAEAERAMLEWERVNEQGKHGQHNYSLDESGVSEEMIVQAFAEYLPRFCGSKADSTTPVSVTADMLQFTRPEDDTYKAVAAKEWRAIIETLAPLAERIVGLQMSDAQDPQLRYELYNYLFSQVSQGYLGLLYADPEHPDFWPIFNPAYTLAPNPDFMYYATPIDGDGVYKISGFRGTVMMVHFGIGSGGLLHDGQGKLGQVFNDYEIDSLHIDENDKSFEVILSPERPSGHTGDWWKLDPRATNIVVRQLTNDPLHEVDARLAIERLDRPVTKPRLRAEQIDTKLKQISAWSENWAKYGAQMVNLFNGEANKVIAQDLGATAGVTTQVYLNGLYEVDADEALIYEIEMPPCRYWNIILNTLLWSAIDYNMNRQTALNGRTARMDSDGKFRAVISAIDPGVPNWLDNAGYVKGLIIHRLGECSGAPAPTLTRVKLADVRKYLPADTPVVSAHEREAAIRLQRKGTQLRRKW